MIHLRKETHDDDEYLLVERIVPCDIAPDHVPRGIPFPVGGRPAYSEAYPEVLPDAFWLCTSDFGEAGEKILALMEAVDAAEDTRERLTAMRAFVVGLFAPNYSAETIARDILPRLAPGDVDILGAAARGTRVDVRVKT
jgi:hypothetical protein